MLVPLIAHALLDDHGVLLEFDHAAELPDVKQWLRTATCAAREDLLPKRRDLRLGHSSFEDDGFLFRHEVQR